MQIFRTVKEARDGLRSARFQGELGLVPTMGALHEGHLSLVRRARAENSTVVASIFVNPLQFGPNEDLAKYPRTFDDDCRQLEAEGAEFLFAPSPEEMYGHGAATVVDPGPIGTRLDGRSRPGHFTGVATVVAKLFHILQPDRAYFGQKDAAQLAVLRQMARDLNFPLELTSCPIVRDEDGLALSSRNRHLSRQERSTALVIPQTLWKIQARLLDGERQSALLLRAATAELEATPQFVLDYLEFVDPATLLSVAEVSSGTLIAIAGWVGQTRLIDNLLAP